MTNTVTDLADLYEDSKTCAQLAGLTYIEGDIAGIRRLRHGKGFAYRTPTNTVLTDKKMKKRIAELVIPPAWQEVWICPDDKGHVLATGIDDKGRKQYIYHPKWRTLRDLIKFYRMIMFARALPKIRRTITKDLARPTLDRDKVIGVMLWLLDNTYLRIGNDTYLTENDSVGLTTLSDKNLVIAGPVITLSFRGKSGQEQQITLEDALVAKILRELIGQRGSRLFRYKDGTHSVNIESSDINNYLHDVTDVHISAKDFRTWGGTLMAFNHLVETYKLPDEETPKDEKVVVQAVDAAANVLGNTRSVARSSYIHPDILASYGHKNFARYFDHAKQQQKITGLDKRETELLVFLEQLFEDEFELVRVRE